MSKPTCALAEIDGPCREVHGRGPWCRKHHERNRRHGDPLALRKRGKGALLAELRAAGEPTTDECIILTNRSGTRPLAALDGVTMLASRAVWILANGDPGDAHVLHTCHRGEEGCINLRHLKLGDNDQNIRDMVEAGRSTRGERDGNAKLQAEQVQEIRRALAAGESRRVIADRYDVTPDNVRAIQVGRSWTWLSQPEDLA